MSDTRFTSSGHRDRVVWVIDVRPGASGSLAGALDRDDVRVCANLPDVEAVERGHVAVGVCPLAEIGWLTQFAAWARAAGIPLFTIAIDARAAFVGPLTVPGRVGCGNCARERIVAAAATNNLELADAAAAEPAGTSAAIAQLIARELEALRGTAPERSRLLDHVFVASADGLILSEHRVISLARCRVCGGAAALTSRHSFNSAPPERLAGWVDPLTGIIPGVAVEPAAREEPGLPVTAVAAHPQLVGADDALQLLPGGWGKGLTVSEAVMSAVGEALERYSASVPDPERIAWARGEELDGDRLDPSEFSLYSDEQYARPGFPYARFDPDVAHPWVRGRWLAGGQVWVPALMSYLSLTLAPQNLICQGTSNGLAASSTLEDAALRATLELVERDAFLVAWRTGEHGRRLRIDGAIEPALRRIVASIEQLGGSVELYALPSACGITALCLALGDGHSWPGATIGLAADLDPATAVRGAILELGQSGPRLRDMLQSGGARVPERADAVEELLDHAMYYLPERRACAFDRLRDRASGMSLSSLRAPQARSLAACAKALEAGGIRVAVVDVTSSDLAIGPYRVVRAVSPDLSPLTYGYGLERVAVKRIRGRVDVLEPPPIHPIW